MQASTSLKTCGVHVLKAACLHTQKQKLSLLLSAHCLRTFLKMHKQHRCETLRWEAQSVRAKWKESSGGRSPALTNTAHSNTSRAAAKNKHRRLPCQAGRPSSPSLSAVALTDACSTPPPHATSPPSPVTSAWRVVGVGGLHASHCSTLDMSSPEQMTKTACCVLVIISSKKHLV